MKKERMPLFENINSLFYFDGKVQKKIVPIKNEILTKMSCGLDEYESIHTQMYWDFAKFLEEYIDEAILCEIWGQEDYEVIYDEKLKLKVDMNSIWDKVIDVCMGSQYGYTQNFTKRNIKYSYEEFMTKVKKIKSSIKLIEGVDEKKKGIIQNAESYLDGKTSIKLIEEVDEKKKWITLDEDVNSKLYKNYSNYKFSSKKKNFKKFCTDLIEICDLALNIPETVFTISYMTIDIDSIEKYINLEKLYLYISFCFLDEIKQAPNIENIEMWKLEFIKKVYDYGKKNFNSDLKSVAAPQIEKANGKLKMGNIETFINSFDNLLKNREIKEKIKNITTKEKEQIKKEPKEKAKMDKIPLSVIAGIEDVFSIQLIINGNNTLKKQIKDFDDFSINHSILEYIKNNYLYSLVSKIKFLSAMDFKNLELNLYLNESGSLEIAIDYISFLESILQHYGLTLDFSSYTSIEEITQIFKDTLLNYGEKLSTEAVKDNEEIYKQYQFYKEKIDNVPYSLYVTRMVDSILELVDYVDLIKEICETNINYKEINKRIDKDRFYLSVAINLFTNLYNQFMKKEKVNKEEYLFLARYIEILKEITKNGYTVPDVPISCEDLLEKYEEFISHNSLYDLDNASLYSAIATPEARKTLFSNWKIIPKGTIDVIRLNKNNEEQKKRKPSFSRKYSEILARKYFLDHTDYDCIIEGLEGLSGYVGYKYKNGIILFEKFFENEDERRPVLGNATYVMTQASFLKHSFKSKQELQAYINAGNSDVKKKNHSINWEKNIKDIINNWGYDPSTIKTMDELIEESKKQKNGAVLSWKK